MMTASLLAACLLASPHFSSMTLAQAADDGGILDMDGKLLPADLRNLPMDATHLPDGMSSDRVKAFNLARNAVRYLGTPYKFGGSSLTKGIDDSHFVWKLLTMSGVDCPQPPVRSQETKGTVVHWASPVIMRGSKKFTMPGTSPDLSALRLGDRMIFHNPRGWKWHTAIYLGKITYKGRRYTHAFVHASGSKGVGLEDFTTNHRYRSIYRYSLRDKRINPAK